MEKGRKGRINMHLLYLHLHHSCLLGRAIF